MRSTIAREVILTAFICSGRVLPRAFPPRAMTIRFFFSISRLPESAFFYSGDRLYFTEDSLRKSLYSNAGARRIACEVFSVYFVERSEVSHVCEEAGCFNYICERCPLALQKSAYIFHNLLSLLCDVGTYDLACLR